MTQIQSLGREDPLEEEMATHPSVLAWRIPWTEGPGGPESRGSQRVRHTLATKQQPSWFTVRPCESSGAVCVWPREVSVGLSVALSWESCQSGGSQTWRGRWPCTPRGAHCALWPGSVLQPRPAVERGLPFTPHPRGCGSGGRPSPESHLTVFLTASV